MENLKGYSGSKFIQIREKNIFFVLSTGRSGTQTFARSLSELPDCVCLHEPAPQLILESSDYRYGRLDCERLKQVILQTRSPVINGKVYGESNQTLSLMVPILAISFPKAKFIWLIRNGLDVVSSIFSRQWYTGHSANHSRYDDCPPLEKAWIDGRIMGDLCGDVQLAKWKSMNPFARCCWYWAYINRTIEKDLSDICSAGSYRKIKLEELDRDLPELVEWLGFGQAPDLEPGNFNRAHYNLYPWQKWTLEERKTFLYWCGPLMDRLYPEWRSLNREFFNTLDVTLKSIKLPGENNFKNQINLQDDHYSNSKIEEFNIYFTPQLKTYPKISVFITSYNQKKYLVETIESVLTQTLNPHQIIIVDDFSNDGSQELIAKYAQKYPNLVFPIYHIKNLGVVQTRIDALNEVSGDYVTYVDGDDRFLPEKLEREFDILARNTNAQIAYSNNYYINPEGQRTGVWAEKEKPPEGSVFKETFSRCFPKSSLFRMELVNFQAWKSVGFHDPDITIYEDFDMRIRLTKHFQVAYCDKPLSEIRLHDKGLSKLKAKQHLASLEFIYHKNRSLLSDLNESDHQRVKKGFNDFVNKISLSAANQLAEDQKIKKQYSVKLSHEMLSASSKKNQPHRSSELGTNLIFLISQPRAGSTLFQRLLAGHPEIHTTAEPWVMLHPLYALKENGIKAEYRVDLALQGLNDFLMQVPEGIELYKSAIRKFGSTLYDRLLDMSGKRFFLDKTPRYYHIIPELFSVFPEANFIFLLRNPVAVLSSVLKTWFGNCVDDLQIENLVDLAKGPVCLLDGIKRLKEKAIVVEYESLVKSPEEIMHRVCTRIGIPYCGDMLEYGRNPKPQGKFGDPVGIFKHHRPVTDNIDKWQDNISSPEFVEISNQYLETLGSDIVSKMGFNFIELKQKLNSQSRFSNTVKTKLNEVRALNKKGENLFAKGEFDDALTNFQKAYNIDPNDAEINNNLGVIYCHQGDHKKASEYYKKAISLQPENVTFKKNLAEIKYVILGQAQEALQIYVNILQTHPDDIEVLLGLGKICIDLEKFDDARVFFNRVIELDPLNVEGQYGLNQLKSSKEDSCAEENNSVSFMTDKGSSVKYLVSAIVSTYNSESFIRGCLEDLEAQTISDKLEIIVVNSGSEQNEERIIKKFQKKYSNINYIRTENRETVYQAWNRGIKAASGKYITNANTDDRHRVDAFERLADELENNRDIGLIYADVFVTNFESQFFGEHIHCGYLIRPEFSLKIMLSGCHMGPQPMWRKSIHEKVGYFSSEYQSAGDYDFWCRVALHYPIKHISEFLGLYYENPDGICNSQKTLSVRETASVKNKYFSHFPSPESPQKYINNYQYGIPVSDHQYVNICMVTFNRLDFTKQAIESILKNTRYPHVISVVDNNSQDGTQEYLTKIKREGIIKNLFLLDENVGVSKASNLAWKMEPDAEYYLKLDNDIVIFKTDWLSDMIKAIDAIPQIGAIAYNFEFQSYPLTEFNGLRCRVKAEGNLGGACILIPRRIREQLGYWCEDYGLYGEEDADYDFRIKCKGLLNVYMEDENIGFHLPGGKAAVIDPHTYTATDGQEEIQQADYRKWKDAMRRNNVTKGKYYRNLNEYSKGIRSLFAESKFADQYLKQKSRSTELNDQIERKEARIGKLKVSIIIPVFNQIELTKKCLNAIFQNTPPDLFEIIIIDNASTDETSIYLSNLRERIKFITNNQNMGFAKACNQGVNKASGKYLLFLNNDTEVQSEWLNSLVEVLDKDKSVAAVGSKLLFPDKTIQHAGVAIVNDQKLPDPLVARHIYYQQAENFPKANEISTYQALTAACLLVRRSAFEAVEGFDELYWNGYEDTDLCFKFQKQGWLLIYQPKSVVIHYESQSGPERFSRVQHNIERLHQKWLGKINPDLMIKPDGTGIETGAGCIRPYQMETSANQQLIDSTELIKQFTSIIILTCNQIEYTKKCIDSIFKHTQEAFELILVDNGSTDGTLEYLESEDCCEKRGG